MNWFNFAGLNLADLGIPEKTVLYNKLNLV